ncbi:MAG TPA: hypothetical protein VLJ86_03390 [Ramlibacter sp.]|nr:hypothetical protein [Ramlibacter sp.]
MTSFVQVDYPTEHPGVVRAERAFAALKFAGRRAGGATVLLAAVVSAMLVVANQVIDTWTEGHLLAAWIVMWLVAFAGLALLAAPARRAVANAKSALASWRAARRASADDQKLWEVALTDARVMADLSRAMGQAARNVRHYD